MILILFFLSIGKPHGVLYIKKLSKVLLVLPEYKMDPFL